MQSGIGSLNEAVRHYPNRPNCASLKLVINKLLFFALRSTNTVKAAQPMSFLSLIGGEMGYIAPTRKRGNLIPHYPETPFVGCGPR